MLKTTIEKKLKQSQIYGFLRHYSSIGTIKLHQTLIVFSHKIKLTFAKNYQFYLMVFCWSKVFLKLLTEWLSRQDLWLVPDWHKKGLLKLIPYFKYYILKKTLEQFAAFKDPSCQHWDDWFDPRIFCSKGYEGIWHYFKDILMSPILNSCKMMKGQEVNPIYLT